MENKRIRIVDIAEELGLSTATVSNVIHGKTKKVSDETVKRVQALLEEKQYIPSMAGILLAQNSSKIIGVFINDHEKYEGHTLEDVFISSSLNHLSTEIEKCGMFMMVKKAKKAQDVLRFASMWNMDGLIIIGFCEEDYMYLRNNMRIPFVVYDGICKNPKRIANITIDDFDGGFQVGSFLRENGHKKAICISDNGIGVDRERMDGFKKAFGEEQTECLLIPMHKPERWKFYEEKLEVIRSVSAVFAVSDYYAIDLIHFLNAHGIVVPTEISIVGFDDIPMCEMITPMLTTVRQDGARRAQLSMEKLRELREGADVETTIKLPVELVKRESVIAVKN